MNYRKLGSTGIEVSEIGLGCEGFVHQSMSFTSTLIDEAAALGVNYIDLYSSNPVAQRNLGGALKGRRNKMILQAHLCTIWEDGQYARTREIDKVKNAFAIMLENLQTDYIDIGMIHCVDSMQEWNQIVEGPVMQFAREMQKAEKIRHIGLSSHNPCTAMQAIKTGLIEVLLFSINPFYDMLPASENVEDLWADESYLDSYVNMDPDRAALYETCQNYGIGITVMKAYGGGDLLEPALSPAGVGLTTDQCLHYALTRPAVASVFVGAHTIQELQRSVAYEQANEAEKDFAIALSAVPKMSWKGHCMYCGHCAPCPVGIDVAVVTKYLNLAKSREAVPETVREHYKALTVDAGACIACGACESRCPFGVAIRANMEQAKQIFE